MASHSEFGKKTTCEEVVDAFSDVITGKTVVITGISPNGLGEAMATALASKQPTQLIFTARSIGKANSVAATLKQRFRSVPIQTLQMDLSSIQSVRETAAALRDKVSRIDILINNAGVMAIPEKTLSVDGHEMHFATNFLGHFLFTNLLVDKLAPNARIVNVTASGYVVCPVRFHDIDWDGKPLPEEEEPDMDMVQQLGIGKLASAGQYNPMLAYLHSTTALILFSVALTERLRNKGVAALSAAPGVVVTELQRHIGGFRNPTMEYKTATEGAASILVAALDPALQAHGAAHVSDCQIADIVSAYAGDENVVNKLWKVAEGMTGDTFQESLIAI